ncbi:MAG TPA: TrkA family potassium uptake protein [Longimicrobiales bacterium]|nr:TrkA family potassium uptake protein [Longimicrobiales bacterium]
MKRFAVIGLGAFGSWVARALTRSGFDVISIDMDGDRVDRFAHEVARAVVGDATDPLVLRKNGVAEVDAAVVSTGDDLASSILTVLALKEVHVGRIVVKVPSPEAVRALERFDVEIVFPDKEAAERLAYTLASSSVLEYIPLGKIHSIQEIGVPYAWIGKSLRELALPTSEGIQVVALYDALTGNWDAVPSPDRVITDSDVAIVAGGTARIEQLLRRKVKADEA